MSKEEFLLIIPAVVFGIAVVDLNKIFKHKKGYYELIGWGLYLLLAICWLWYETYEKLGTFVDQKWGYFLLIIQAVLYSRAAAIITPEEKDIDTKNYYMAIKKPFFLILASIAALLIFYQLAFYDDGHILWVRFLAIPLLIGCAFIDNAWLRNGVLIFYSVTKIYLIATI